MSPEELKEARRALGLSVSEIAEMLDTDETSWRKMTRDPSYSQHRPPAPRMVRLLRAYLSGYRPPDWPA